MKIILSLGVAGLMAAVFSASGAARADGGSSTEVGNGRYAQWKNGPSTDPNWFPIGVWAQDVRHAGKYKAMGVNFYLSLAGGPTDEQLAALKAAGLRTICHQNEAGLKHLDDPTIMGWMHGDEPDNFTKEPNGTKWVPKTTPAKLLADYEAVRKKDPTRPVLLNLGQGVANDAWKGGWAKAKDYTELVKGCDVVSYDIYPMCSEKPEVAGKLELIPLSVERLRKYGEDKKIAWFITEASHISNKERMASPDEMRSEVWMALIRGARGIVYFCHQWEPNKDFAYPANNPAVREAVTGIDKQVLELAPVLNSPTISDGASIRSVATVPMDTPSATRPAVAEAVARELPIDILVKKHGGATYVFVASQRNFSTAVELEVKGLPAKAKAEVLGENRQLDLAGGKLSDKFKPYAVHLYKIVGP